MNVQEFLSRAVSEVYIKKELEKTLNSNKKLRAYYGVDPSGPVIHLGHAVHLRKLGKLQKAGHKVIFLIGDFTGMIGDPTDRTSARQPLTRDQVLENAKTYKKQVSRFINFDGKNPAEIRFNSEWNDKLTFKDLIQLASRFTVQRLLERDMYQERIKAQKPISLHEFLYPVIQGYDAVMLEADVQIGGTDQTFNMLQGRELRRELKNKLNMVITLELLEGTDGRKMSKSFNNIIAIEDKPTEMYGKIISLKDELIIKYFELATELSMEEVKNIKDKLKKGENPRNLKAELAFEIVKEYYGDIEAQKAQQEFDNVFKEKNKPTNIEEYKISPKDNLLNILVLSKTVSSGSDARRLAVQKAIKVNDKTQTDIHFLPKSGDIIQVGKRRWLKIK